MKRITFATVVIALLCIVVAALATTASLRGNLVKETKAAQSVGNAAMPSEAAIIADVQEYWKAALEGDMDKANEYLTKTPMDYIRNCKSATPPEPEDNSQAENKTGVPQGRLYGLSLNTISENWTITVGCAKLIRKNSYHLRKAFVVRQSGDEAVVHVSFGSSEEAYLGDNLLLHQEDGKWKIFAHINNSELAKECDNFARSKN